MKRRCLTHWVKKNNEKTEIITRRSILVTGRIKPPEYVKDTETKREFQSPQTKSIENLKKVEENRLGRYAYSPNQNPPCGIRKFKRSFFLH